MELIPQITLTLPPLPTPCGSEPVSPAGTPACIGFSHIGAISSNTMQASILITSASPESELHLQFLCSHQEIQMHEAHRGQTCVGQI